MLDPMKNDIQFRRELFLAVLVTGLACVLGFSNVLLSPNNMYPGATDFIGHMAKIQYITECLEDGIFPSWFPFWYNGTATIQYYPPLSYYLIIPIYALTKNVMLTFKISNFLVIFIGGIGVWLFCRMKIGRWCGLFGAIAFCIQPYILWTLLYEGQIAQGPFIALAPWYLYVLIDFSQQPSVKRFIFCTIICSLLILSHASSIFMYCICIMMAFAVQLLLGNLSIRMYLYLGLTIVFSGILTAFWSLVGVTGLENPSIPYLIWDAVSLFSAAPSWYFNANGNTFYFAIPITIVCIAALLIYSYCVLTKRIDKLAKYIIGFCITIIIFSVTFSFGIRLPFYKYLPMSDSIMPGRILNLTSVVAAILCAYVLHSIINFTQNSTIVAKVLTRAICLMVVLLVVVEINPLGTRFPIRDMENFDKMISPTEIGGRNFEKGRYTFLGSFDSSQTYFPLQYDFNLCEGFNIEGTIHHIANRNHMIANVSGNYDYIAKNLAFWNMRYILLSHNYDNVSTSLAGFQASSVYGNEEGTFYTSPKPSSYFLIDKRNALIFGEGASGLAMEFPYLVREDRNELLDYTVEELSKFKLIYICEPNVNTIKKKRKMEIMIEKLIENGVTIVIEPTSISAQALFDVISVNLPLKNAFISKNDASEPNRSMTDIQISRVEMGNVLFGLDKISYKMVQNGGLLENELIGTKKTEAGEVVFIGKQLTQQLKAVYVRNWGAPADDEGYPTHYEEIKNLFDDLFDIYGVNKDFWPESFPVKNVIWNYKGVDFDYSHQEVQEMVLSVTYAPRWRAFLDGKPIAVGQRENLIVLDLPSGEHHVKLAYEVTKYGIVGYIISLIGLLLFILFIKFYDIIVYYFKRIGIKLRNFFQV